MKTLLFLTLALQLPILSALPPLPPKPFTYCGCKLQEISRPTLKIDKESLRQEGKEPEDWWKLTVWYVGEEGQPAQESQAKEKFLSLEKASKSCQEWLRKAKAQERKRRAYPLP